MDGWMDGWMRGGLGAWTACACAGADRKSSEPDARIAADSVVGQPGTLHFASARLGCVGVVSDSDS